MFDNFKDYVKIMVLKILRFFGARNTLHGTFNPWYLLSINSRKFSRKISNNLCLTRTVENDPNMVTDLLSVSDVVRKASWVHFANAKVYPEFLREKNLTFSLPFH